MRLTPHGLLGTLEIKEGYKMLKSELVHRVADKHTQLYQRDIEKIVNAILDEITSAMARATALSYAVSESLPAKFDRRE